MKCQTRGKDDKESSPQRQEHVHDDANEYCILKGTSVSVGFHATVTKARARFAAKQLSYRKVRIKRNFKEEGH